MQFNNVNSVVAAAVDWMTQSWVSWHNCGPTSCQPIMSSEWHLTFVSLSGHTNLVSCFLTQISLQFSSKWEGVSEKIILMIYFKHNVGRSETFKSIKFVKAMSRKSDKSEGKKANSVTNWFSPTFVFTYDWKFSFFSYADQSQRNGFLLSRLPRRDTTVDEGKRDNAWARHGKGCWVNKCFFLS